MRRAKIVVTIGPATSELQMIKRLIKTGVNVFRLNFSHGDHETHAENIRKIRQASEEMEKEVAILQDISGPKVRIGEVEGVLKLHKGVHVTMQAGYFATSQAIFRKAIAVPLTEDLST